MSLSAYAIQGRVWVIATEGTAEAKTPATLPMGSLLLEPDDAKRLAIQLAAAGDTAAGQKRKALPRVRP